MNNQLLSMAQEAGHMFLFLAAELTVLFLAISYLVGVLQEFITPQKIQSILSSKNGRGYFVAALLGSITPFCSCSTIPFLKGLLRARAGFGPMMVFLFASPLLNPVIIGLFVVTFGFKVAIFYFAIAMLVSVVSGYVLEKLGFEKYVRQEAYQADSAQSSCSATNTCAESSSESCGESNEPMIASTSCCTSGKANADKTQQPEPTLQLNTNCDGTISLQKQS